MPGMYTHKLCSDFVAEDFNDLSIMKIINDNYHLYTIGGNGPDFLFFSHIQPNNFWKDHKLNYLGSDVHNMKVNEFYSCAVAQILKQNDQQIKERMMAYLYGHITHWALDKTAHPYIIFHTGNLKKEGKMNHHRLESSIDALYKLEYPKHFDGKRITSFDDSMLQAIARIYVPVAKDVFDRDVKVNSLRKCLEAWDEVSSRLIDESGKKMKHIQNIEKIFRVEGILSRFVKSSKELDTYDVCNREHKEWMHPYGIYQSNASFDELVLEAKKIAVNAIERVHKCIETNDTYVNDIFNDENYHTGTSTSMEMKYFSFIYD